MSNSPYKYHSTSACTKAASIVTRIAGVAVVITCQYAQHQRPTHVVHPCACAHAWQTLPGLELLLALANAGVASVVSMNIHHGLPDGVRSVVLQPVGPKGLRDVHLIIQLIIQVIGLLKVIKVLKALIVQFVLLALTAA